MEWWPDGDVRGYDEHRQVQGWWKMGKMVAYRVRIPLGCRGAKILERNFFLAFYLLQNIAARNYSKTTGLKEIDNTSNDHSTE